MYKDEWKFTITKKLRWYFGKIQSNTNSKNIDKLLTWIQVILIGSFSFLQLEEMSYSYMQEIAKKKKKEKIQDDCASNSLL